MKKIDPSDIVAFAPFCGTFPIATDVVYANPEHSENHFGQIYHPDALIWGHRDTVKIVLLAASRLKATQGWTLVVKDCLRTVEAQEKIGQAPISLLNPQWFQDPPFMSPPGKGAHPRGMAVDITAKGVDMGTPVDHLNEEAARSYKGFSAEILDNRKKLETAMVQAGKDFDLHIHPLSNEWWDFRFLPETYNQYAPLSDADLLPRQRMVSKADKISLKPDAEILKELSRFV